ncbi:MAG: ComF family protein [Candidatus Lloydbacteria bacterium]|nr:ComF family protein [Candidatus Lloydbacteria bacterium]
MRVWYAFLDLLFPIRCAACGVGGRALCQKCLEKAPSAAETGSASISALYRYEYPPIKKALWALKYRNNRTPAEIFGTSLYEHLLEHAYELTTFSRAPKDAAVIIVPIPLSKKRLRERGFNQSEKIIEECKRLDKNKSFLFANDILCKTKETAPQASTKDRPERLKNIRGCFAVANPEKVKNKVVIVVDDITTTGATLREAITALEHAGAARAIGIAIAH